jgi:hypothetical protein
MKCYFTTNMFESQMQNSDLPHKEKENVYHYKLTCKFRQCRFCYVRSRDIILHVMCVCGFVTADHSMQCVTYCVVPFVTWDTDWRIFLFVTNSAIFCQYFASFFNYRHGAKHCLLKRFPLKIHETELRQSIETLKNKQTVI